MATEDQIVPIDFGQGFDTKSDSKQVLQTKLSNLINRIFSKEKQLKKVPGFTQLTQTTSTGGTISSGQNLATFNDELLLLGNSSVYGYSEAEAKWVSKGKLSPAQVTSQQILKNSYSQSQMDTALAGNYQVIAWLDSRGGVRCSVLDLISNTILVGDTSVGGDNSTVSLRVVPLTSTLVGFYYCSLGGDIKLRTITIPTMTISSESIAVAAASIDPNSSAFDIAVGPSFNVIAYPIPLSTGASNTKVAKLNSAGVVGSTTTVTTSVSIHQCTSVFIDPSNGDVFLATGDSVPHFRCCRLDSTLSAIYQDTQLLPAHAGALLGYNFLLVGHPTGSGAAAWYVDGGGGGIDKMTVTAGGVASLPSVFHSPLNLASKPFLWNGDYYLQILLADATQGTLFTAKSDGTIVARMLSGIAGDKAGAGSNLPKVVSYTSNIFNVVTQFKSKIQATTQSTAVIYGLIQEYIDFTGTVPFQSVQSNNELLISGGVTMSYDGVSTTEKNFHLYPVINALAKITTISAGVGTVIPQQLVVAVTQTGDASHKQIFTITPCSADFLRSGQYFTWSTAADATLSYAWFNIDGTGTDPAPVGRTGTRIDIGSNWTATQVGVAIYKALFAIVSPAYVTTLAYSPLLITVTNPANGSCTAATNVNAGVTAIGAGTYSYAAVFEWTDAQGNVHRSTPSIASSVIVSAANTAVNVLVNPLTVTEKKSPSLSDISIVVYRTQNLGTIYYRVSSFLTPSLNNAASSNTINFMDIFSDAQIAANEILYTNGGVVENSPPPCTTILKKARNRVWLYSPETKNLWYSKTIVQGTGIQFSDLFTNNFDASGDAVKGIAELDDKVIISKKDQPFYIIGDGPNDTGQGASFSLAQKIIAPTGIQDATSVQQIPTGLIFKSPRGFYLLDRKLQSVYIGAPAEGFNSSTCLSSELIPDLSQVRFLLSSNEFLIYDFDHDQWSDRTVLGTVTDAILWKNVYTVLKTNGIVWTESQSNFQDNSVNNNTTVETAWIKPGSIQGFQRVKAISILGDYKSAHTVTVELAYDYSGTYTDTYTFTPANQQPLQVQIQPRVQKCQAIRIRITDTGVSGGAVQEGNTLTNISFLIGMKAGLARLPLAQKG